MFHASGGLKSASVMHGLVPANRNEPVDVLPADGSDDVELRPHRRAIHAP